MKIHFPSKEKMCKSKRSFRTLLEAERVAAKFEQRSYHCPICFTYHNTSKENWQDEFLYEEDVFKVLGELVRLYEKSVEKLTNDNLVLKNQISNIKSKNGHLEGSIKSLQNTIDQLRGAKK